MPEDNTKQSNELNDQPATTLPELLTDVIERGVDEGATDIHIDGWRDQVTVRYRIDGLMHNKEILTMEDAKKLVNQIKVAARLSPEATHAPLEGQLRWSNGESSRDIRVTIIPTAPQNEVAHLRLLTAPERCRDLLNLGMTEEDLPQVKGAISKPHGLILIAGPTGSGKTTTLYALGGTDELRGKVIASIEDPAEFDLPYVRQLEVNLQRGLTMEAGLRTLLRMDPDVLMVGEIRDHESAMIAAQAALSGRLVIATIHGRDAAGAVQAMHHLAVPYHILGGALRLVIAQNLVRSICKSCSRTRELEEFERRLFARSNVAQPGRVLDARGCDRCNSNGYLGRSGVFQVAPLDEEFGLWLSSGPAQHEVRKRFIANGANRLIGETLKHVAERTTSMAEVERLYGFEVERASTASDDDLEAPLI